MCTENYKMAQKPLEGGLLFSNPESFSITLINRTNTCNPHRGHPRDGKRTREQKNKKIKMKVTKKHGPMGSAPKLNKRTHLSLATWQDQHQHASQGVRGSDMSSTHIINLLIELSRCFNVWATPARRQHFAFSARDLPGKSQGDAKEDDESEQAG